MSSQTVPKAQSTTERLQEIVGDLHHHKPISESSKQQIRLNPGPAALWMTKEIVASGCSASQFFSSFI